METLRDYIRDNNISGQNQNELAIRIFSHLRENGALLKKFDTVLGLVGVENDDLLAYDHVRNSNSYPLKINELLDYEVVSISDF